MDYIYKQFAARVKKSKDYDKYRQSVLINLNNFAFVGIDNVYTVSYLKDENGIVLTDAIIIINIYLPNLLEKCYTKGVKSLNEVEKYLYALVEDDESKLKSIMEEMPMAKKYVEEAKEVSHDDNIYESYDHEQASLEQKYIYGYEDGEENGAKKSKIEMVKAFYENGASLGLISKSTKLSIAEVKEILNI